MDAFQKAIREATYDELTKFIGFRPQNEAYLDEIDLEKIDKAIKTCHHLDLDKKRSSRQPALISFRDILAIRDEAIPSGDDRSTPQAPEPDKKPPQKRSEEALQAIERIVGILGEDWRKIISDSDKITEEDLLDWTGRVTRTSTGLPI
jgi:hypothetical protein